MPRIRHRLLLIPLLLLASGGQCGRPGPGPGGPSPELPGPGFDAGAGEPAPAVAAPDAPQDPPPVEDAKPEVKPHLFCHKAESPYPFGDDSFDLVISLTTLHNLRVYDLKAALREVERAGKHKYLVVESYRDEAELFNLECWALTCESFYRPEEWIWLFGEFGYTGDYEFIYFE